MLILASGNGRVGLPAAWEVLRSSGSALDAVEAGIRVVEDDPAEHSVGYGGYPNLFGVVELDASIMDGTTRRAGAVGALRGYRRAITVARAVMEHLPHVVVVGEGAARLAAQIGEVAENVLTDEAATTWERGLGGVSVEGLAAAMLAVVSDLVASSSEIAGTVNFIGIDAGGALASGVSTSGWAWKYPGRLGDSPVIGAGNYADGRYGAATCTGHGELSMRASTARMAVARLEAGMSPRDAGIACLRDLVGLGVPARRVMMNILVVSASGEHWAGTTPTGADTVIGSHYAVHDDDTEACQLRAREVVELT